MYIINMIKTQKDYIMLHMSNNYKLIIIHKPINIIK